jgi:hypothetical protein
MHWLKLPPAQSPVSPAFADAEGARRWLSHQPRAQPGTLLGLLGEQIGAIDAAGLAPAAAVEILGLLRHAALPALDNLESRYTRKALPMADDDLAVFEASQRLWLLIAVANLRLAPQLGNADKCLPLHRAANALRQAQYCHYLAGRECPQLLDQLLVAVLIQAEAGGVLRQAVADPDYPHLGEANIAGLLAWSFLLRLSDPYALSGPQLTVANRALSRWRELCTFQAHPEDDPKAVAVDLTLLFGEALPAGLPHWFNVRPVVRKIRSRIASLKAGETPEALKLGRELSATACMRLLGDIERQLRNPFSQPTAGADGEIELAFGTERAFAVFTGEELNPSAAMTSKSATLSHERMGIFGFDNRAQVATAVQRVDVPTETWLIGDGQPWRPGLDGPRLQVPCLVSTLQGETPHLGVLSRLLCDVSKQLSARLRWYDERIEACWLKSAKGQAMRQPRTPAFLLHGEGRISLIVPVNAGVRLDLGLELEGASVFHLVPVEVLERGVDFVRYACRKT